MISVICPTYNEINHIEQLINFVLNSEPNNKELIIVDGNSIDGTAELVKKYSSDYPNVYYIHNPDKYVPFALNKAIKECRGEIIVRLDAHSIYGEDYFLKILEKFETTNADIVGGPYRIAGGTNFQKAVGEIISSPFGTGNSKVHDITYEGLSDSVAYGAWKKVLFDEIGNFDERLKRNQDDEFHYRAVEAGKKIIISPEIMLWYYPRKNLNSLFKQYYEYGLFKPLVITKIKSGLKIRHLIPSFFVLYLLSFALIFFSKLWLVPILLYMILDFYFSFNSKSILRIKILRVFLTPVIHCAYGIGFLLGFAKLKNRTYYVRNF